MSESAGVTPVENEFQNVTFVSFFRPTTTIPPLQITVLKRRTSTSPKSSQVVTHVFCIWAPRGPISECCSPRRQTQGQQLPFSSVDCIEYLPEPGRYHVQRAPSTEECGLFLVAPADSQVDITFEEFEVDCQPGGLVEVRRGVADWIDRIACRGPSQWQNNPTTVPGDRFYFSDC